MSTMASVIPNNNNNRVNVARGSGNSSSNNNKVNHRTAAGSSDLLIASASSNFSPMFSYENESQMYSQMEQQHSSMQYPRYHASEGKTCQQQPQGAAGSCNTDHGTMIVRRDSRSECIHSGHFMVSEIDESEVVKVDEAEKSDGETLEMMTVKETEVDKVVCEETPQEYTYGSIDEPRTVTIDSSLSRLLQCMTLAYEERKLVSPKWNSFKGLRLKLKDKIRLNNIIWRCWHMQYKTGRKPPVCQFATMTDVHNKPEAVLLEGKYWRRGQDAIKAEYLKWRMNHPYAPRAARAAKRLGISHRAGSEYGSEASCSPQDFRFTMIGDSMSLEEDELMNWDDTVFSLLQPGFGFPSQREIARSGFGADLIQPSLSQLQPPFNDFYDDDIFHMSRTVSILPTLPEEQDPAILSNSMQLTSLTSVPQQDQEQQQQQQQQNQNQQQDPFQVASSYADQSAMSTNMVTVARQQQNPAASAVPSPTDLLSMDFDAPSAVTRSLQSPARRSGETMIRNKKLISNSHHQQQQQQQQQQQHHQAYGEVTSQFAQLRPNELPLSAYTTGGASSSNIKQPLIQQQHQGQGMTASSPYETSMYPQVPQQQSSTIGSDRSNTSPFAIPQSPALKSPSQLSRAQQSSSNVLHHSSYSAHTSPLHHHQQQQQQHHHHPHVQSGFQSSRKLPSSSSSHVPFERSSSLPVYSKSSSLGSLPHVQDYSFTNSITSSGSQSPANSYQGNVIDSNAGSLRTRESSLIAQLLSNSGHVVNSRQSLAAVSASSPIHSQLQQQQQQQQQASYQSMHQRQQPQLYQQQRQQPPPPSQQTTSSQSLIRSHSFSPVSSTISAPSLTSSPSPSASNSTTYNNYVPNVSQSSSVNFLPADMTSQQHSTTSRTGSPMSRVKFADDLQSYPVKRADPVRKISSPARICSNHPAAVQQQQPSPNGFIKDPMSPSAASKSSLNLSSGSSSSLTAIGLTGASGGKGKTEDRKRCKEHRRVCHINAEQKRRCNIKNGFDTLRAILPSLSQNASTKVSKAAMLQKAAEHVRQLKAEKQKKTAECQKLEKDIDSFNHAISSFQSQLPATGAPVSCRNSGQTKELFAQYVRERTQENWKFYIFSMVMDPMLESFDASTNTGSVNDLCKSTMKWVDQSCSLVTLRKDVLNSLRTLCTTSSIISNPSLLPAESLRAVLRSSDE